MVRTQVYLGDTELELLERTERETGASRSELICRAVQSAYGEGAETSGRLAALERAAGVWKRREVSGAAYVDALRGDLDARLTRLGIE